MDPDWCWTVEGSVADWNWMGRLAVNRLYVGIGLVSDFFVFSGIGTILVCRSRIGI